MPVSTDVRVDGSGRNELVTLRGNSTISYKAKSPILVQACSVTGEGDFAIRAKKERNDYLFHKTNLQLAPGGRKHENYPYFVPVVDGPSLEINISGVQYRTLLISKPEDYYLLPIQLIRQITQSKIEAVRFSGTNREYAEPMKWVKASLKNLSALEHGSRTNYSIFSMIPDMVLWREGNNDYEYNIQCKDIARHIFPFWDSTNAFALCDSVGPIVNFHSVTKCRLTLEGQINAIMPEGFMLDGVEYDKGKLNGKGKVVLDGGIDRLALDSPLQIEADFARITGDLYLVRSDGIIKDWPTSVQLSPASLQLKAESKTRPNPWYWTGVGGLWLSAVGITWPIVLTMTGGLDRINAMLGLLSIVSSPIAAGIFNTMRFVQDKSLVKQANISSSYSGSLYAGNINPVKIN